jgi:hypothetical protein
VAFLASETAHLADRHTGNPQLGEDPLDVVQLEGLDDALDFSHAVSPFQVHKKKDASLPFYREGEASLPFSGPFGTSLSSKPVSRYRWRRENGAGSIVDPLFHFTPWLIAQGMPKQQTLTFQYLGARRAKSCPIIMLN